MVRVALISDIHGRLSEKARRCLEKCDYIVCAGDTESLSILSEMEAMKPLTAVRGNCDWRPWASDLPKDDILKVEDVTIYVIHNIDHLSFEPDPQRIDVVVYGHTHRSRQYYKNDVLYVNPGSASEPRGGDSARMAVLEVDGKSLRLRPLYLE